MALGFASDEELEASDKLALSQPLFVGTDELTIDQRVFLNALLRFKTSNQACKATKINKFHVWNWRHESPAFLAAYTHIRAFKHADAVETIEKRCVDGYKQELSYQGVPTGQSIKVLDTALMRDYLKAHDPKYRDGGVTVNIGPQSLAITYPNDENSLSNEGSKPQQPQIITQQSHNLDDDK